MRKTKVFKALNSLKQHDITRLQVFYASEFLQENSKAGSLLKHLCEERSNEAIPGWNKEQLWNKLEGNVPYNDQRFRKICSDALQMIERFLSVETYLSNKLLEHTVRLEALSDQSLESLYRSHLNRVKTLSDRWPVNDATFFYHQYQIEQSQYEMSQARIERFKVANIDRILYNIDVFYIIEKLRFHCEVLSRKTFVKHEYDNRFIDHILEMIALGEFSDVPVIGIYYQIVLTHLEPEKEEHYFELKKKLNTSAHLLHPQHMKEVYDSALNYCARKINQGRDSFLRESFDMYKELLKKELLFVQGHLSQWTFKNVVILALRLGEYTWAERFIQQMQIHIKEKYRQNAVTYNLAQLHFYRKDYAAVLHLLQAVEYHDVSYNLGAKTMLLATYYEQEENTALQNLGDSFRAFINRRKNTIPETRRRSYLNLIRFTLKLANLPEKDLQNLKKLEDQIESTREIASEQWIRSKVREKMKSEVS